MQQQQVSIQKKSNSITRSADEIEYGKYYVDEWGDLLIGTDSASTRCYDLDGHLVKGKYLESKFGYVNVQSPTKFTEVKSVNITFEV